MFENRDMSHCIRYRHVISPVRLYDSDKSQRLVRPARRCRPDLFQYSPVTVFFPKFQDNRAMTGFEGARFEFPPPASSDDLSVLAKLLQRPRQNLKLLNSRLLHLVAPLTLWTYVKRVQPQKWPYSFWLLPPEPPDCT